MHIAYNIGPLSTQNNFIVGSGFFVRSLGVSGDCETDEDIELIWVNEL